MQTTQEYRISTLAQVEIGWKWEDLYAAIEAEVAHSFSPQERERCGLIEFDPRVLERIAATLFLHTAAIARVHLVSCEVEVRPVWRQVYAHLRELGSDSFLLWARFHPHVIVKLRVGCEPKFSLLRSKQALLESMSQVVGLLHAHPTPEDSRKQADRERLQQRVAAAKALLKRLPGVRKTERVLVAMYGAVHIGRDRRSTLSINSLVALLSELEPGRFRTIADVEQAVNALANKAFLELRPAGAKTTYPTVKLLASGEEYVTKLLS